MKRSRAIRLVLLGSVGLVGLAGCDDTPVAKEGQFFRDVAECRKVLDAASCESQFAAAKSEHAKNAPRFTSREACEQKFGAANCAPLSTYEEQKPASGQAASGQPASGQPATGQPAPQQQASSGSSFFVPLMLGYLGGQLMGRMGQPVYRDQQNTAYSSSSSSANRSIGSWRSSGPSIGSSSAARTDASAPSTQRGGFGGTASRMSSGSGS
ncbi:MAG: DUF1190 domain-containing protein [Alphaproteobacteria bacterium]